MRNQVINRLVEIWRQMVMSDDVDPEFMEESLREQISGECQGWDCSAEDLEENPELAEMLGYDIDNMTDEQWDEWQEIVTEAAKIYLGEAA